MRKKMTGLIFAIMAMAMLFPSAAGAEDWQWCSGYRTITQIFPDSDFQFYLSGTTIDVNSSCSNRFVIRDEDTNYAAKVASLLTAFQNGGIVLVYYDHDDTGCGTDVLYFKIQLE